MVTQADIDGGSVTNHASGTGKFGATTVTSNTATLTITATQTPSIDIAKSATLDMTVVAPNGRADAGDKISYGFTATNTGNVTLTDIHVTDPLTGTDCLVGTLAPGGVDTTCSATYTVAQTDIDAGSRANTATVRGERPGGDATDATDDITDTDTATVLAPRSGPSASTRAARSISASTAGPPRATSSATPSPSRTPATSPSRASSSAIRR